MKEFKLYGDGINDDLPYIQSVLDSGVSELYLPNPKKCYMISGAIKIHSNQTLKLGNTTIIRLMDNTNTCMLKNADWEKGNTRICIDGGIWDMNNLGQRANPSWVANPETGKKVWDEIREQTGIMDKTKFCEMMKTLTVFPDVFIGHSMIFCRIKDFTLKNVTLRNPVVYGAELTYVDNFSIENITFDYTTTKFNFYNNDGIHLEGGCKNGVIRNLKGRCYDDMVALTCDDGPLYGEIENITIDGLFSEHCHSAIRLLSHGLLLKNISIRNVFGSYFKYCIGLTKFHGDENERGIMQNISIQNVFASSTNNINPLSDLTGGNRPIIWVQSFVDVEDLVISNVVREEKEGTAPLLAADENTTISRLTLENITQKNLTGHELGFIDIKGKVSDKIEKGLYNL